MEEEKVKAVEIEATEVEAAETEETEVTEAAETEETEIAETEATEAVETEETEAAETEETEIAETEATEAVETEETEETEAVESETTEIEATETVETEETEVSVDDEETYASLSEVESNATVLSFGKTVTDKLTSNTAENWYKFTSKANGYFQISFSKNAAANVDDIDWGWDVYLYADSNLTDCIKSYRGIKDKQLSSYLPLGNRTCYIKVCANYNYSDGYAPTNCPYDLTVSFTGSDAWETEYNDTSAAANTIPLNKNYSATLYQAKDVDWYKVNITERGYFKFNFIMNATADDTRWGWDVAIYDSSLNELKNYRALTSSFSSQALPFAKGTYYVKVCAYNNYSDYYAPTDCIYKLNVVTKASTTWESEKNDTQKKATSMALNKTYSGIHTSCNDVDWYKITVKNPGVVKIKFAKDKNVSIDDVGNGWNVYVYNKSADQPVKTLEAVKNSSSVKMTLKKGDYYIKVCAYNNYSDYYAPTQCVYKLSAMYSKTPAQVTLKSVKGGKKQETITWNKASGATGYYVYRSTSKKGKYTKIATIKKASTVSYKDKKSLKSKKTYYYKVVAYRTENGVTATGKASAIKSAKTK